MKEQTIYLTIKTQTPYAGSAPMANAIATAVQKKPEQEAPPPQPKKEAPKRAPVSPQKIEAALKKFDQRLAKELEKRGLSSFEQLPADERTTYAAIRKMVREKGYDIPPIGGGSGEVSEPTTPDINIIAQEINQEAVRRGDQNLRPGYLEEQIRRVQKLIDDKKLITSEAREEALAFIKELNQRVDEAHIAEDARREQDEERRHRRIEDRAKVEEITTLKKSEAVDFDPYKYTDSSVQANALVVERALANEKEATIEYLAGKIKEMSNLIIANEPDQANPDVRHRIEEATKLNMALQKLKNLLYAKITRERGDAMRTLYGEIRQSEGEIRENVQNAIDSILKRDAGNETLESANAARALDAAFNRLFTRVAINANNEWRDALGSAGQIEFDLFLTSLGNAASDRGDLPIGRGLTQDEKDAVNKKVRELKSQAEFRQFFHDLSYYINRNANTEEMHGAMKRFPAELMDMANQMRGVTQMNHFFEQAMFQVMAKNAGYIPYEAMVTHPDGTPGEVEQLVIEMAKRAQQTGILPDKDLMEDWEIKRAISLARGLRIANGRAIEIVAQGGIPRNTPLVSWWANNIIKKLAFFRQVARYNIGFERNRVLAYKLDKGSPFWSIQELAKMKTDDIIERFNKESNDDRFMDMINPARIGGGKTQTGWRYGKDDLTQAGVLSALLKGYDYNPLIGAGMWIEKERRNLTPAARGEKIDDNKEKRAKRASGKTKKEEIHEELLKTFPNDREKIEKITTKGELAEYIIGKNLDLVQQIVPLKLFFNLKGLQQQVLAKHYVDQIEVEKKTGDIQEDIKEGQILIKGEELNNDLRTLALAQERLLQKRTEAYVKWEKNGKKEVARPDLYTQFTDLEAEIKEVCKQLHEEDPKYMPTDRSDKVIGLANNIRREFDNADYGKKKLLDNLKDRGWKVPYIFGEEDIPEHLYQYGKTGGSSLQRRWGDMESVDKAMGKAEEFIMNMTMFRSQDDIIKGLNDIYQTLRGHDEGVASEFIFRLSEGVIKFYKKDLLSRLPFGIGTFAGLIGGKTSYAQFMFGREQMAWDEIDILDFIRKLHAAALLGPEEDAKERIKHLKKHTGAAWWCILLGGGRTVTGLGLIGFIYYMLTKSIPEEYKKAA